MLMFTTLPFFHLFNFKTIETYYAARFEKETRYYVARISQDLLSDWIITITNGRINSRLGQSRTIAFQNFHEAFEQLCLIAKTRHQRGYRCTAYRSDSSLFIYLLSLVAMSRPVVSHSSQAVIITEKKRSTCIQPNPYEAISHQQLGFSFNPM
jgi:predicted DNA-binding WGR domain protein